MSTGPTNCESKMIAASGPPEKWFAEIVTPSNWPVTNSPLMSESKSRVVAWTGVLIANTDNVGLSRDEDEDGRNYFIQHFGEMWVSDRVLLAEVLKRNELETEFPNE